MWLKLLLLTLYLLFLFILTRIFEATSWYQDPENIFTSFVALNPIEFSVKKLKQILDGRGISYNGVVEKQELIELVESSGQPNDQELLEHDVTSKTPPESVQFTCGTHFYEEVEDTKDSAWLVQVVIDDDDAPILSKQVWNEVISKVSAFGIRTGQFKCSLDKRLCHRKGWTSSRLILALPQGYKAKEDVVIYDYLPSTTVPVLQWVRNHLASRVKKINSIAELKKWMEYSDKGPVSAIRIIFFSVLKSCPMFLSALAIKFNGRVDFGIVDVTKDKDAYKKAVNGLQLPTYLVISPEKSFTYGRKKGESYNFKSMEIFLKTFVPEMNDALCWSLIIINVLASFELFIVYLTFWKHFVLFCVCVMKYNFVLMLFWMLITTLNSFPFMVTLINILLKCIRMVSGSYIGSIIRNDYKIFYSYTFIAASFVVFASVAGFIVKKYKLIDFIQDDEFSTASWWFEPWEGYVSTYFFRHLPNRTRSGAQDLDLEVGMELLIERLAVPNLWLQPVISMDYLKDLPLWKYQGWCKADDLYFDSCLSSDDESANITTVQQIMNSIVPKTEMLTNNLQSRENSISSSAAESSQGKECKTLPDDSGDSGTLESQPIIPSMLIASGKIKDDNTTELSDSERAPKGMLEFRECSICLEKYKYGEVLCGLPCGHNFHINCIMTWLTRDNHCCPICRWPSYKAKNRVQHLHLQ